MAFYSRKTSATFAEVVECVTENLRRQGFGVTTTIDLKDTFRKLLDVRFRNYKIIGACNPEFAYSAVSLESHLGALLPCNVVIQEHENGEVEVTASNPLDNLEPALKTHSLDTLADKIDKRLRLVIDELHHHVDEDSAETLPTSRDSYPAKVPSFG